MKKSTRRANDLNVFRGGLPAYYRTFKWAPAVRMISHKTHARKGRFLFPSSLNSKMAEIREVYAEFLAEAKKEVRRRWPGSDTAHKISEDFSKVSEWTLKRNLERPSKRYQYDFVQSFPIMKRELNRIRKILVRKTRPRATLKNQWKSIAKRAMPREVFLTLEHYLAEKGAVDDVSRTKCRCTLTGHQGLEDIFK